ncbi:multidrug resistance protein, MATE family [Arsukibacterium tuosuense]|uniref:Multidrug resistance protein, MATE family n=1 Tax=Arsukibacterium tuosuense TaxID=1323745 RepID=A0A285IDQ3_9GAMM|nr:MATE family efflux transporter DinF [Arsukibacterium tuosuense]SNY45091.1 multidrug resistance protein, MATE family [Arsukibacterium tuosuense]
MLSLFLNAPLQKKVAAIALPMVLSNLSVPLLALVDTAVSGHLAHAWYLGGVALGSSLISLLFFLLGFLRMSTTGLTAQAYGANDSAGQLQCLSQSLLVALLLAALLLLLQWPLAQLAFSFSDASSQVNQQAQLYFGIRIWSAPATLINLVLMGWFLGRQNARYPMWMLIVTNLLNIILDLVFVLGFGWQVAGIAAASVVADYGGLLLGGYLLLRRLPTQDLLAAMLNQLSKLAGLKRLFALNRDIFLRSLCLQSVFVFIAFQGAAYGDNTVAANAVLLSFLMLVSYAMDGLAYAAESLVGKAIGARDSRLLGNTLGLLALWCLLLAIIFSAGYGLFGNNFVGLLTSLPEVQQHAALYLGWMILLPLLACWAYFLDGVFIGATQGKTLRNSMVIALLSFAGSFYLLQHWQNHALWAALSVFMLLRSTSLAVILRLQWHRGTLVNTEK